MVKKDLKFYEAPQLDAVELEAASVLLAGSDPNDPFDGKTGEPEEV